MEGVYRQHGKVSYAVIGTYVFLILVLLLVLPRSAFGEWVLGVLVVFLAFFLVRYLSTAYILNDSLLRARRIPGSRRLRLETIRRIEYASMRDLSPTGFVGSWGWRGRMWSPSIGHFDAIYTDPARGLLVSGEGVPVYITPVDLEEFAKELSRRVRSYTGRLPLDVGNPEGPASEPGSAGTGGPSGP